MKTKAEPVDMSAEAISLRLAELAALYQLARSLSSATRRSPGEPEVVEAPDAFAPTPRG